MNKNDFKDIIIRDIANKLNVPYGWLDNLIKFETAGTYDPKKQNRNSSAKGLIQFIDMTARELGYDDSEHLIQSLPDFESQMYNAVLPYLKKFAPFKDKQDFYMSVFYPKYRHVPPQTPFPDYVKRVNPGIDTVSDYVEKVDTYKKIPSKQIAVPVLVLTGAAILLYFCMKV